MIPDGEYVAVVDRFEDDLAVLLLEEDEETVAELPVPQRRLPGAGCHQDAVLEVTVRGDNVVGARYDEVETDRRAEDAQEQFDRLSRRPRDSSERSERESRDE
jgi:hypothetical protein